jgi:hypothetical protein
MKKVCLLLAASLVLSAGWAFATTTKAASGVTATAGEILTAYDAGNVPLPAFAKLSTGVFLGFNTSAGTYAITTKHKNGNRTFGAAANDGKNYFQEDDTTVGSPQAAAPTASDSSAFNGWSAL